MGTFAVGDVVLVNFPFSDLSSTKKRPALVIGLADFGNVILCQITSQSYGSGGAVQIQETAPGTVFRTASYARPDKLFTADPSLITAKLGVINSTSHQKVKQALKRIFEM